MTEFVSRELCEAMHGSFREDLSEIRTISLATHKLLVGNGQKGLMERQNNSEMAIEDLVIKMERLELEKENIRLKKEQVREKWSDRIWNLFVRYAPMLLAIVTWAILQWAEEFGP
jgi:hypothetical protein